MSSRLRLEEIETENKVIQKGQSENLERQPRTPNEAKGEKLRPTEKVIDSKKLVPKSGNPAFIGLLRRPQGCLKLGESSRGGTSLPLEALVPPGRARRAQIWLNPEKQLDAKST